MAAAPLVLAGLAQVGVIGHGGAAPSLTGTLAAKCQTGITDYQTCHDRYPTGCSATASYDGYLNALKNELIEPSVEPQQAYNVKDLVDLEGKLPAELAPTNHEALKDALGTLGEGEVSSLLGYLYYAKPGSSESSNCQLTGADDLDFHIGIGPDPGIPAKGHPLSSQDRHQAVIVEMTPHWRAEYESGWTLAKVRKAVGRQVFVVGQLLADNEHHDAKDDCGYAVAPGPGKDCWRPTIWELHPVTRFLVCATAAPCAPDGSGAGWTPLEKFNPSKDSGAAAPPPPPPAAAPAAAPNAKPSPAPQKP
jgi:hypothetical protein